MATDKSATVLPEVERFNRLSATWWDAVGPMRPLRVINGLRLGYVLERIAGHFARPLGDLTGLRMADVGCGAGLMCEPLAERRAQVVGVDAAAKNIAAARLHANVGRLNIDYRVGEPEAALHEADAFDVLLLLEVVEHVDNLQTFVRQAARHLKPGGLLLISTINRTPRSFVTAIVGAEYIFRVLPRGTTVGRSSFVPTNWTGLPQLAGWRSRTCVAWLTCRLSIAPGGRAAYLSTTSPASPSLPSRRSTSARRHVRRTDPVGLRYRQAKGRLQWLGSTAAPISSYLFQ